MEPSGRRGLVSKYATETQTRTTRYFARSGVQLDAGGKIRQLDDVGRQEEHLPEDLLRRHGHHPGAYGRRSAEAVQEGGGELQAAARSEDAPRGRRQLPGAGGSSAEPPRQPGDPMDSVECPLASGKRNAGQA